jgi:hypothetical protein
MSKKPVAEFEKSRARNPARNGANPKSCASNKCVNKYNQ